MKKYAMRMTGDMLRAFHHVRADPKEGLGGSVTVWACSCGIQYKAICEIDRKSSQVKQTSVICSHRQAVMKLDGVVSSFQEQSRKANGARSALTRANVQASKISDFS